MPNYRQILWKSFCKRKDINEKYSLRSFARDLDISHSRLSLIFQGKQGLSYAKAEQIALKLRFDAKTKERFCNKVEAQDSRSKQKRTGAKLKLKEMHDLAFEKSTLGTDTFSVMADWYNYALLELTRTHDFKNNIEWIAQRLRISEPEATETICRLKRLGLLKEENGMLKDTEENLTTTKDKSSLAIRKFNQQILDKAKFAIETQSLDQRDFSTLTLAVPKNQIGIIKTKIKEFRRSLNGLVEESMAEHPADEVYCLSVQFFCLSNKEPK